MTDDMRKYIDEVETTPQVARSIPPLTNEEEKEFAKKWSQLFPKASKD